jgi:GDPmannose 4,6-dehydratase
MLNQANHIKVDPRYFRAEELKDLKGDSTKLRDTLGWKPEYTFETLIDDMMNHWKEKLHYEIGKSEIH